MSDSLDTDTTLTDDNVTTSPSTNAQIDRLTLSLLMNKESYSKYISYEDPQRASEIEQKNDELQQYKDAIIELTMDKLKDPHLQISQDIDDLFDSYTHSIIRYLKHKEIERSNQYNTEDMMFGEMDIPDENSPSKTSVPPRTHWDHHSISKQSYFTKNHFSKNKF
jgi:hypothetical protein